MESKYDVATQRNSIYDAVQKITEIPDSYQGVSHLNSPPILSDSLCKN